MKLVNGIKDYLALGNDFWGNFIAAEIIIVPTLVVLSWIVTSNIF
ncbi:hypothetical protein [Lapidilactobacillus dextrinicus]|nr:hypothetical protein [Lapidilactobacillus dextrinicus]